jgi:hypothetical protein
MPFPLPSRILPSERYKQSLQSPPTSTTPLPNRRENLDSIFRSLTNSKSLVVSKKKSKKIKGQQIDTQSDDLVNTLITLTSQK